jgi:LysM repeat protein
MAAIIQTSPRPTSALPYRRPAAQRPDLRLIQGGRRPASPSELLRRRLVAGLVAVLVVLAVGAAAVAVGRGALAAVVPDPPVSATPGPAATGHSAVVVRPGDTYWSIARRLQPTGDVRPLVDRLAAGHGNDVLRPGERLAVD